MLGARWWEHSTITTDGIRGTPACPCGIYLVSFVVLGSALSIAGPALSHLHDRVGTDDGGISLVFVASSAGRAGLVPRR